MRLLFVHSDHLEFEATQEVDADLAEREGVPLSGRMEECVTAFITVESGDSEDVEAVVADAADELRDVAGQLNTARVVLYPYAHLSDDLAAPDAAKRVLRDLEAALTDRFEVLRAPFGWYKAFEVSCKGHPLSELSRHVSPGREADADAEGERQEPSEWHVLTPDGDRLDPHDAKPDLTEDMRAVMADEIEGWDGDASTGGNRDTGTGGDETGDGPAEPPHVRLMHEKGLVDYDGLSDAGNLRWYPRGKLVRDLLAEYVNDLVVEYGGMPVETPVMYDLGARAIAEHAGKFGERQYRFESGDRRMMLRFAACFGQFSVMRDTFVSESDLPLRIYELAPVFRREQRGEVVGLRRQRAFTMPDMHTAARDIEEAKEELERQAALGLSTGEDLNLHYEGVVRVTRAFHEAHREWVESLAAAVGEPVLLEVLPERRHYWSAKVDFAVVDSLGRPIECPTVQIDVESAERFDVTYTDGEDEHHPNLLHYSPTGSVERLLCALLEHAATQERPRLPTWLAPTQVRFVPVARPHVEYCDELADKLEARDIRVDVDDRDETVGKRIARAETDWVPYYAVVGDRELDGDPLGVNRRAAGDEVEMTVEELVETVEADLDGLPRRRRYLPRHVGDHPNFAGG